MLSLRVSQLVRKTGGSMLLMERISREAIALEGSILKVLLLEYPQTVTLIL